MGFVRRNFLPILIGSVLVGIFTYQQGYFAKLKSKLNICGKGKSKVDSSSDDSDDVPRLSTRSEKKGKRNKKRGSGGGRPGGDAGGIRDDQKEAADVPDGPAPNPRDGGSRPRANALENSGQP